MPAGVLGAARPGDTLWGVAAGEGANSDGVLANARARVDDIRRALTETADENARSRLRVRLADLLSAMGDSQSALAELRQAAAEGTVSAGLLFGMRVVAPHLRADEVALLRAAIKARRSTAPSVAGKPRIRPGAGSGTGPTVKAERSVVPSMPATMPARASVLVPAPAPLMGPLRETQTRLDPVDEAFAALAEGKPIRARRLGEEAARAGGLTASRPGRLPDLIVALERAGSRRESLRLARSLSEIEPSIGASVDERIALLALV
ncbi:MAG: hypothetical protein H7X95_11600, partial [Deltaproteobacteria bacterium]|nr:hypothetical protein [Deltaproteobacteria bacterium]